MPIGLQRLDHVNLTVPRAAEAASREFYGSLLGLAEIPKPAELLARGGAWFDAGGLQLHVSLEDGQPPSRRHVCFTVTDLEAARARFIEAGVAVLPDERPVPGWARFYVLDPGGNRLEIAQPSGQ
jgi:catechol 2,3-dioxygenase-like lactoylglutathione lyase family enzyme